MPEKTVKRRLQDCDAALASDDGPIFSTVAKLVEALDRQMKTSDLPASPHLDRARPASRLARAKQRHRTAPQI
jgi:hypothetical protein